MTCTTTLADAEKGWKLDPPLIESKPLTREPKLSVVLPPGLGGGWFGVDHVAGDAGFYFFPTLFHCGQFGWAGEACISDRYLAQGDEVQVGEATFWVRHCPGHTPGHVVFFHPGVKVALVGDVLFRGSIGRTDFPRGNHQQLLSAITERLWPLGDDVRFVPGHGPMSTFGHERKTNPFVSDAVLASA